MRRLLVVAVVATSIPSLCAAQGAEKRLVRAIKAGGVKGVAKLGKSVAKSKSPDDRLLQAFGVLVSGYLEGRVPGMVRAACQLFRRMPEQYGHLRSFLEPGPSYDAPLQSFYVAIRKKDPALFRAITRDYLDIMATQPSFYLGNLKRNDGGETHVLIPKPLKSVTVNTVRSLELQAGEKISSPAVGKRVSLLYRAVKGDTPLRYRAVCTRHETTSRELLRAFIASLDALRFGRYVSLAGGNTKAWGILLGALGAAEGRRWPRPGKQHWDALYRQVWPNSNGGLGMILGFANKKALLARINKLEKTLVPPAEMQAEAVFIHHADVVLMNLVVKDEGQAVAALKRLRVYANSLAGNDKRRGLAYEAILRAYCHLALGKARRLELPGALPKHLVHELLYYKFLYILRDTYPPQLKQATERWLWPDGKP